MRARHTANLSRRFEARPRRRTRPPPKEQKEQEFGVSYSGSKRPAEKIQPGFLDCSDEKNWRRALHHATPPNLGGLRREHHARRALACATANRCAICIFRVLALKPDRGSFITAAAARCFGPPVDDGIAASRRRLANAIAPKPLLDQAAHRVSIGSRKGHLRRGELPDVSRPGNPDRG